jgi:hypothetical protein
VREIVKRETTAVSVGCAVASVSGREDKHARVRRDWEGTRRDAEGEMLGCISYSRVLRSVGDLFHDKMAVDDPS